MKSTEDLVTIGVILKPHGIAGEVKVLPTTDDPRRFSLLQRVFVQSPQGERLEVTIEKVNYHRDELILRFNTCLTRNDAERLRKWEIQIPREKCLPLPDERYYIFDLIGLQAETTDGKIIGIVKDVLTITNNDLLVIETPAYKEVLVPFVKEFVKDVTLDRGRVFIQPIEGLLE